MVADFTFDAKNNLWIIPLGAPQIFRRSGTTGNLSTAALSSAPTDSTEYQNAIFRSVSSDPTFSTGDSEAFALTRGGSLKHLKFIGAD